ncbi:GNAT family N-acetyltransferase [Aliikangiella coralliicola]|uniref:GNAT family N-acetyltransferase n=1 Tax=Aliikangiella coralliicola TaxID=2592383 RepID=A0A545UGW9_9GAMM|nr:GNAT family N-acetyltransferase [Aliikangiella coralliicola]TQV88712.1 GNAT family N-acetyltransferase [Aliikangiella coralliicola]
MRIKILTRNQANQIDSKQWDELANKSQFVNPFYERWSLLPALEFLQKDDKVYLVTASIDEELVALFPIKIEQHSLGIRYLSVWQHDHCFICDPLCSQPSLLVGIIRHVVQKLKVLVVEIQRHSRESYGHQFDLESCTFSETRGVIFKTDQISNHLESLPRKVRAENRRVKKRLFNQANATYLTSKEDQSKNWLKEYCQLEHTGWKGIAKGSILSNENVYRYYQTMFNSAWQSGKVEFQGLFSDQTPVAISFRIISRNRAFELKTSYHENYRQFYPGVVLELMNIEALAGTEFKLVDSCTSSENYLINRLWPDQRNLYRSLYFHNRLSGKLLKMLYKLKNRNRLS